MTSGLTTAEFDACFQRFADSPTSTSVLRWEGWQHYAIAADEPSLVAFREGGPRPERSVRTSPWLSRIATSTAAGKDWSRIRYVTEPLSEYVQWEMLAYVESQATGERILVTRVRAVDHPDFWLFSGTVQHDRYAIVMHYEADGTPREFEYVEGSTRIANLQSIAVDLSRGAETLNHYLAPRRGVSGAA